MYKEELTESGIVKESKDGIAEIIIPTSAHCEECTAKIYCKPSNDNFKTLFVKNPLGAKVGDCVMITIKGTKILKTSFFLYGIPLILLLAGLFVGMEFFQVHKELFSTFFAFGLVSIYILIIHFINKKRNYHLQTYPEIVFVSDRKP